MHADGINSGSPTAVDCDFSQSLTCPNCGYIAKRKDHRRTCRKPHKPICRAGCQFTKLLKYLGIEYISGCNCESHASKMDRGLASDYETISIAKAEAAKRNLVFVESQVRWLVDLANSLAAESRGPTRIERIRLRAMRIANRMLNG